MAILDNKVALVTRATSGTGRAVALVLGTAGAKVVFSGRHETQGDETAKLGDAGAECSFVRSDASSEEQICFVL